MGSLSSDQDVRSCRSCRASLQALVLDLGDQPVADLLLDAQQLNGPHPTAPLRLFVCARCGLVQLPTFEVAVGDLSAVHGHGAAFSTTMRAHLHAFADQLLSNPHAPTPTAVLDVASGEGTLLEPFLERDVEVLGLEPNPAVAAAAAVPTRHGRFDLRTARELVAERGQFDLILVNHALAHADDLNDTVAGLTRALRPDGRVAIEFHHALSLARGHFDVACHAHAYYLSLCALEGILARHGLAIVDAKQLELHGGSVRAIAVHADRAAPVYPSVRDLRAIEREAQLDTSAGYRGVAATAQRVKHDFVAFLDWANARGARVAAYGAPSRGITLLNYCAVTIDRIAFTVDRSPAKQGRFLPGSGLPVLAPEAIEAARPDYVVILPWALRDEISEQMSDVRRWGGRFVVAMPELRILD
jgi:SAM-dependent methyltransferase